MAMPCLSRRFLCLPQVPLTVLVCLAAAVTAAGAPKATTKSGNAAPRKWIGGALELGSRG